MRQTRLFALTTVTVFAIFSSQSYSSLARLQTSNVASYILAEPLLVEQLWGPWVPAAAVADDNHVQHIVTEAKDKLGPGVFYIQVYGKTASVVERITSASTLAKHPYIERTVGVIHAVWQEYRDGQWEIVYSWRDSQGWYPSVQVSHGAAKAQRPRIFLDSQNNLAIEWEEKQTDVVHRKSCHWSNLTCKVLMDSIVTPDAIIRPAAPPSTGVSLRTLAFMRNDDIWSVQEDGSGIKQITSLATVTDFVWSPDGERIAYIATGANNVSADLYLINSDGSGLRKLTNNSQASRWVIDWWGTRIFFIRDTDTYPMIRISTVDVDASFPQIVDVSPDISNYGVGFDVLNWPRIRTSPNGHWVALAHGLAGGVASTDGLLFRQSSSGYPEWRNDSEILLQPRGTMGVFGFNPRENATSRLLAVNALQATYSPDDTNVLYGDGLSLRRVNLNGVGMTLYGGRSVDPEWSRDGQKIAFATWAQGDPFGYYTGVQVMNADGTGRVQVASGNTYKPRWKPSKSSDATLIHLEITQVIQDETNGVPLIAGKPTFVRAYVSCQLACTRVSGMLHAYGSSGELPGSPIESVNGSIESEQQPTWTKQRSDLTKSLNFILPVAWIQGKVTLRLELPGRELSEPRDVTFAPMQTVRVGMIRVQKIGEREQGIEALFLGQTRANTLFPVHLEPVVLAGTIYMPSLLSDSVPLVLRTLELQKTLYNLYPSRDGSQRIDKIFGWLPDSYFRDMQRGGASPQVPDVAFGENVEAYGIGELIFAHEIAHTFGILHTNRTVPEDPIMDPPCGAPGDGDENWPPPDARINDWGIDGLGTGSLLSPSSGLKGPRDYYDVMSYCWGAEPFLGKAWISPHTYSGLFSAPAIRSVRSAADTSATSSLTYAIASGAVLMDGTAMLEPIIGITSIVTLPQLSQTGEYCLETRNISDAVIDKDCFQLAFEGHLANSISSAAGFVKTMPLSDSVMQVVLLKNGAVLTSRLRTSSIPMFRGVPTTVNGIVSWSASDNDGDSLVFTILYSSDGSTWLPIAANIGDTHYSLPLNELPGSQNARVRVLASDGLNTSAIDSSEFTVASKPPIARIETPRSRDDTILSWIGPLVLQGGAYDYEDGNLEGGSIHWSSSIDGSLGTGEFIITKLSRGQHIITLSATDSDGNNTSTSFDIYVGARIWLPFTQK